MASERSVIGENVRRIREEIAYNPYGERVTIVAATKTRSIAEIEEAIRCGVDAIAENRAQEFRDKEGLLPPFHRRFIGRLQSNKLKYIVGKVDLIESCDGEKIAAEISELSSKKGVVSDVLLQVNVSGEESKGGVPFCDAESAYRKIKALPFVRVRGFMTMLPAGIDEFSGGEMIDRLREFYDKMRREGEEINVLSAGMSDDYVLCVKHGSNTVRIGRGIFGAR